MCLFFFFFADITHFGMKKIANIFTIYEGGREKEGMWKSRINRCRRRVTYDKLAFLVFNLELRCGFFFFFFKLFPEGILVVILAIK